MLVVKKVKRALKAMKGRKLITRGALKEEYRKLGMALEIAGLLAILLNGGYYGGFAAIVLGFFFLFFGLTEAPKYDGKRRREK